MQSNQSGKLFSASPKYSSYPEIYTKQPKSYASTCLKVLFRMNGLGLILRRSLVLRMLWFVMPEVDGIQRIPSS